MNGVRRRTFTVMEQEPDSPAIELVTGLLTREEANAQQRVAMVDRIDSFLHEHGNLHMAQEHSLRLEPSMAGGLVLMDHCESRPCPWFGDGPDYDGPTKGSHEIYRTWIAVHDPRVP